METEKRGIPNEKLSALINEKLSAQNKKWGSNSVYWYGEAEDVGIVPVPTGALSLDLALGIGGMPLGRIIEVFGPESSGKTTLALQVVAEIQAAGGTAAYIDAEYAVDMAYAMRLGVDVDELVFAQPATAEEALDICERLAESGAVNAIVIDSVAALVPRAELEGEIGDATIGLKARLMAKVLPELAGVCSRTKTMCIFINQLREKIGTSYGNPETTTGGRAMRFFTSLRIDVRRGEALKVAGEAVSNRVKARVVKTKVGGDMGAKAEFEIVYGEGVSKEGCVLDMAKEAGIVKQSGSWFSYDEERLGQGREAVKLALHENPELLREIESQVRQAYEIPEPDMDALAEFMMSPQDGKATVDGVMSTLNKKYGENSVFRYGDADLSLGIEAIPTGALPLDYALGIGGMPRGRVVEIFGPESSGKTTLALQVLAEAQALGGIAVFIDAEHAFDPTYARRLGVDMDDLVVGQPTTAEEALDNCIELAETGVVDIIVVDSVAALVPRAELEGEIGDVTVGLKARLMSKALPRLIGVCSRTNTLCIFINQLREKIGVFYGNPEITPGGNAMKYMTSLRVDIRRIKVLKDRDGRAYANRVKAKVVKTKIGGKPHKTAEFDIVYGEGTSREGCVLDMGVDKGIVKKSGGWFTYGETRLGQGEEAAKQALRENPEMLREIERLIREAYEIPEPRMIGVAEAE